jgi:tetratricopeptide (TPR) repeat protein
MTAFRKLSTPRWISMDQFVCRGGLNKTKEGVWAVVFCLSLCALPWGHAQQQAILPGTVADPLRQARDLLQSHNLPEARKVLEDVVRRRPDSAEAWLLLADTYSQLGMEGEAIQGYQTTLKLQPNAPNALYNVGILLLRRNRREEAAPYLEAFHRLRPRDQEVLYPLADCLFQLGRTAEGQQAIEEVMNTAGDSAPAYLKAGQFLLAHGRAEAALVPLGRALNLAPASDESRIALALAESQLGHPARVIELLQDHSDMHSPLYASLLGSALCDQKEFARAVPLLETAVREHSEEKLPYLQLAASYAGLSKGQEAVRTLQQAHARWPEDVQIRSALARQLFRVHDPIGALVVLREPLEKSLTTDELNMLVE